MILFLYGSDTYRSRKKLREIVVHYKKIHQSGLNLKYFDLKENNFQDFKDGVVTTSMFKEKKLFILTNVFTNPEFKGRFLKPSKRFTETDDIILFYEGGAVSQNDSLFKFLKTQAKVQEFKPLTKTPLKNWIKRELAKVQTTVTPQALDKLVDFVGNNLWQMSQEIKKLVAYTHNRQRKEIQPEDIDLLVKAKIETDIFKTIDAIASKDKKTALRLLHKHLEKGDNPLYLLSMINYQFRNLLIVKDLMEKQKPYYSILKEAKLHPFVVQKCLQQAQRFRLEELKKIFHKIFQIDVDIKTGRIDPETALDLLITEI